MAHSSRLSQFGGAPAVRTVYHDDDAARDRPDEAPGAAISLPDGFR